MCYQHKTCPYLQSSSNASAGKNTEGSEDGGEQQDTSQSEVAVTGNREGDATTLVEGDSEREKEVESPQKVPGSGEDDDKNEEEIKGADSSRSGKTSQSGRVVSSGPSPPTPEMPYTEPHWSGPPSQRYFLTVIKSGSVLDEIDLSNKPFVVQCIHSLNRTYACTSSYTQDFVGKQIIIVPFFVRVAALLHLSHSEDTDTVYQKHCASLHFVYILFFTFLLYNVVVCAFL